MLLGLILSISVLLQFAAAFAALRLSKVTGTSRAWIFVSLSIFLMGVRRLVSFYYFLGSDRPQLDLLFESLGLVTSLFMFAGVSWIAPLFHSIRRTGDALQYRFDIEKVISGISADFINIRPDLMDRKINHALAEIGKFTGVDRAYMFLMSENLKIMSNTHEWCKDGIEPQIANLQGIPLESLPVFEKKIIGLETFYMPDIGALPPEAEAEKRHFNEQGIKSLVVVPIVSGGALYGFLGFDSAEAKREWIDEDIRLLKVLGEIFLNAVKRKKAEEERDRLILELRNALSKVKLLSGFLPICASCKKIRDDKGYWNQIEGYIRSHSEAEFTHGICPDCARKLYPDLVE